MLSYLKIDHIKSVSLRRNANGCEPVVQGSVKDDSPRWNAGLKRAVVALFLTSMVPLLAAVQPANGATLTATTDAIKNATEAPLAPLLGSADIVRYKAIRRLQKRGQWKAADRHLQALENTILLGHMLFQRLMHPEAYRAKYAELADWMQDFSDHPGAARLYRLAKKRQPKKAGPLTLPQRPKAAMGFADVPPDDRPLFNRSLAARPAEVRRIFRQIKKYINAVQPTRALTYIQGKSVRKHLSATDVAVAKAVISSGYFYAGLDKKALNLAQSVAEKSRKQTVHADWIAGLAAWRLQNFTAARTHFEALANSENASPWNIAAGAYWAARAYLVSMQPDRVNALLAKAAAHSHTFYGQIAARLLGRDHDVAFTYPRLVGADAEALLSVPGVVRARALVEIGEYSLADDELRQVYLASPADLGPALLGVAHRLGLPATQMRLARGVRNATGGLYTASLFPLPPWQPQEGYSIDRALIFAFIRQESAFRTSAKSPVGARGLMQLMPATASYVSGDSDLAAKGKDTLFIPTFNIAIGEKYIGYLLDHNRVESNLFLLAAAYNGGPGNLYRWLKNTQFENDPLLFIESIPSWETRDFVEHVLSNLWMYRRRLNQPTPSLDAVASGHWPYYSALDVGPNKVVSRDLPNAAVPGGSGNATDYEQRPYNPVSSPEYSRFDRIRQPLTQ